MYATLHDAGNSAGQSSTCTLSDSDLLGLVARGDARALESLYDRYAQTVYSLLLRIVNQPETAEDLVQETFWRIWKQADTYAGSGSAAAWLLRVARNQGLDALRRRRVRPQAQQLEDVADDNARRVLTDTTPDLPSQTWSTLRHETVRRVVAQLPDVQRQAIELSYFHGFTQQETAALLNTPLGTVKTRVRLGIQKLEMLLRVAGVGDEGW